MAVKGEISGVARRYLADLVAFSTKRWPKDALISEEDAQFLQEMTEKIGKEIVVYVNRNGFVEEIALGSRDSASVNLIKTKRSESGYLGVKLIHTHPRSSARFSEADIATLEKYHFDAVVALGSEEKNYISLSYLEPNVETNCFQTIIYENLTYEEIKLLNFTDLIRSFEKLIEKDEYIETAPRKEKTILVFQPNEISEESKNLECELFELAKTANLEIVGTLRQKQRGKNFYFGEGKRKELAMMVQELDADCVIFDKRLTPAEASRLTFQVGIKVLDKTALILDIFAQRAKSREGKLQVELAQLEYLLPRLIGKGLSLSRQGGGIGTRGPGETQLETDRRHIRKRIENIKRALSEVGQARKVQNQSREKAEVFHFSLVGYTNAGKSSLLNLLTNESIYVADQLFATLDSTTRKLDFFDSEAVLLSDTVGFIRDLPPELVNAFKSTLSELEQADVILHVVDISQSGYEKRISIVEEMLLNLGLAEKKQFYIFNKIDQLKEPFFLPASIKEDEVCLVSVHSLAGIEALQERLRSFVDKELFNFELFISYSDNPQKILANLHKYGQISDVNYDDRGATLKMKTKYKFPASYEKFIINN